MTLSSLANVPVALLALSAVLSSATASSLHARQATPQLTTNFTKIGTTGVSAQQLFLATPDRVVVIDKSENNQLQVDGHPAWGTEFDLSKNNFRPLNILSNTFCAGGNVLGNGTWINAGGNSAINASQYQDSDGTKALRLFTPCEDKNCEFDESDAITMTSARWYPTVETIEDGSVLIMGGDTIGGYINDATQNNPTYEFWPPKGDGNAINYQLLVDTLPANLFPILFLLPSGKMFVQANFNAQLLNYTTGKGTDLPDVPNACRTYPASAASVMLPLTPDNNWSATILLCGGSNIQPTQWNSITAQYPADSSCVYITPDAPNPTWQFDDSLPEARVMGNFITLPDGTSLLLNGAGTGVAGYGNIPGIIGQSNADHPTYTPLIYDPRSTPYHKFSRDGLATSDIPRMYHSSATLLTDGSVMVAGSNPNADVTNTYYPTEYRAEIFYPPYFTMINQYGRPNITGVPTNLAYGGNYFNLTMTANITGEIRVAVIRTGFSTHALNMGQRYLVFNHTQAVNEDNSVTLHVQALPPSASVYPPGPAWVVVTAGGIPSMMTQVMVGTGKLGVQPVANVIYPPANTTYSKPAPQGVNGVNSVNGSGTASTASSVLLNTVSFLAAGAFAAALTL